MKKDLLKIRLIYFFINLFLMGINFIYSIFFLIYLSIKKRYAIICWCFLFGSFAAFSSINQNYNLDIVSYYQKYEYIKNLNWNQYQEIFKVINGRELYIYILLILLKAFSLPKEAIPFISNFLTYFFLLKTWIISHKNIKKDNLFYFLFSFFLIPWNSFLGVRFYLGATVLIYTLVYYYINKKILKKYLILSFLIHYSLLFPIIIFLLYKLNFKIYKLIIKNKKMMFFICYIIGNLNLSEKFYFILSRIGIDKILLETYLNGKFGIQFMDELSFLHYIFNIFEKNMFILIFFTFIFFNRIKINGFITIYILINMILQQYRTIFERNSLIIISLIFFINLKTKKKIIYFYIFIVMLGIQIVNLKIQGVILLPFYKYSFLYRILDYCNN